jgi:8-oxo-dGTP pyrophosphatase MutT (NUDIX family)
MVNSANLTEEEIIHKLSQSHPAGIDENNRLSTYFTEPARHAAVLIPFLRSSEHGSPWHILLTRRTDHVADHKGQVAFPGGRAEADDPDALTTALREAYEEIGILPNDVSYLGTLEPLLTITNYRVVPVIGIIPWPYELKIHAEEVSRAFTIPLEWLADPENFEVRSRQVTFPESSIAQSLNVYYYQPYDGELLWGVSAEIMIHLLTRLGLLG